MQPRFINTHREQRIEARTRKFFQFLTSFLCLGSFISSVLCGYKAYNHPELMIAIGGYGVAIGFLIASFWFAWARIQVSN